MRRICSWCKRTETTPPSPDFSAAECTCGSWFLLPGMAEAAVRHVVMSGHSLIEAATHGICEGCSSKILTFPPTAHTAVKPASNPPSAGGPDDASVPAAEWSLR